MKEADKIEWNYQRGVKQIELVDLGRLVDIHRYASNRSVFLWHPTAGHVVRAYVYHRKPSPSATAIRSSSFPEWLRNQHARSTNSDGGGKATSEQ